VGVARAQRSRRNCTSLCGNPVPGSGRLAETGRWRANFGLSATPTSCSNAVAGARCAHGARAELRSPSFRANALLHLIQGAAALNSAILRGSQRTFTRRSRDGALSGGGERSHRSATVRKVRNIRLTVSASSPAARMMGSARAASCSTRFKPPITAALPSRDRKESSWALVDRGISRRLGVSSEDNAARLLGRMIPAFCDSRNAELGRGMGRDQTGSQAGSQIPVRQGLPVGRAIVTMVASQKMLRADSRAHSCSGLLCCPAFRVAEAHTLRRSNQWRAITEEQRECVRF
jgi:hypothetical protein